MMCVYVHKNATYPLEIITFLEAKEGGKLVAIPEYGDNENHLYLADKAYQNYQGALARVGALMDKMDYPKALNVYKSCHPLSCPEFYSGYSGTDEVNPYEGEPERAEWEAGVQFRLSESSKD